MVTFCTGPPLFHAEHASTPSSLSSCRFHGALDVCPCIHLLRGPLPRKPWPQDKEQMPSQLPLLPRHPQKAAPRLPLLSVFPFPRPAPGHAHACPNLTCLSRLHICSGGRASVLSVPATPCCDLPPEQDTPPSWGFSGPGAQLAHLCLFIHAVLQPLCGQTQEVLGTGSWVSPAQPGSGWAQGGSQEPAARPCSGLALMPVCPPPPPPASSEPGGAVGGRHAAGEERHTALP